MREPIRLGLILMLICVVTGGALAYVNGITKPAIATAKERTLQESLAKALPGADDFTKVKAAKVGDDSGKTAIRDIYRAYANGKPSGYVVDVDSKGYSGPVRILLGLNPDGGIEGLEVVEQTETPGLGTQVKDDSFRAGYKGITDASETRVTKDGGKVHAITGATISSRAVSTGVAAAMSAVAALPEGE